MEHTPFNTEHTLELLRALAATMESKLKGEDRIIIVRALYHAAKQIEVNDELVAALELADSALDNTLRSAGTSTAGFIAARRLVAKAQIAVIAALEKAKP